MEFGLVAFWQDGWVGAILRGASVTIAVSLASMLAGLVAGFACAVVKWRGLFPLTLAVDVYTSLIRGVPELLGIYLLFFGSVELVTQVATAFGFARFADSGYAFVIAVIAIGAISGAYSTEVVRGALAAVPEGQVEAARALGMTGPRIFRRIVVPQMLRIALPGLDNVWQVTIKDTALVSVVGLQELMRTAYIGSGTTRHPFIFYAVAGAVYLAITLASQLGFNGIERALRGRARG